MSLKIDNQIKVIDKAICRHISKFEITNRGEISQDILKILRDFVEHLMLKVYAQGEDIAIDWDNICNAKVFVKPLSDWKTLTRFHDLLEKSVSHYTPHEENSERLMLKYFVYLFKIRETVLKKFSLEVLSNLDSFPLYIDTTTQEYYEKIAEKIDIFPHQNKLMNEKFYIRKVKPFIVKGKVYYEVTFTPANDYANKFDRVIAFTNIDVSDFYAVKFALTRTEIKLLGKNMTILVITGWEVAIRDCEYYNFTKIIRGKKQKQVI